MANYRLRDAIFAAGLKPREVADRLQVDPKTVHRWLAEGRTPYPRHRYVLVELVGQSESYLWPDTATDDVDLDEPDDVEVVHVYSHRSAISPDLWRRLFNRAAQRIDILVYAGLWLPEQLPSLTTLLQHKAEAGVSVRLLLGDPDCDAVMRRSQEEGIGDAIPAKIRNVLAHYQPLAGISGIETRLHQTTLYSSIYRFDDEMIVNHHVLGVPAAHAPAWHLRRHSGGDLLELYVTTFERVWSDARPAWPEHQSDTLRWLATTT